MIVRNMHELVGSERDVPWGNGQSRRLLLASDGMGFAVCDTQVDAGTESRLEYRNHLEACYCIAGEGEVEDMDGNVFALTPGVMYALDRHDEHLLRAHTDMRLVSVFNPALAGHERHSLSAEGGSAY